MGDQFDQRADRCADLIALQYKRNDSAFQRGTFRVRGDTWKFSRPIWKIAPGGCRFFGDEMEAITEFDPLTGEDSRP